MKILLCLTTGITLALSAFAHEGDKDNLQAGDTQKVTGQVLDLACYVDHGAAGDKHDGCARKCIESGLPVGLKADDGKTYLLIGEHAPLNKEVAPHAGEKITVAGKIASRDGINMIENAVVQQ
ncbi:MAG TPA: hypothetical protein VGC85_06775 [Chthoniobacterales bacterium]